MNYKPRPVPPDEINNSEMNPYKVLLKGGVILAGISLVLYTLSAFLPDLLTPLTPVAFDKSMGDFMHSKMKLSKTEDERLNRVISLTEGKLDNDLKASKYFIIDDKSENAYATPGGRVYFTSGFLNAAESENEILFVLGHELGHQKYRHPIRSLYTNFLGSALMALIGGTDRLSSLALQATTSSFSREQETEADLYGLELVQRVYGHTEGAFSFFERVGRKYGKLEKFSGTMFSSHPMSQDRIDHLNKVCRLRYSKGSCGAVNED